MTGIRKRMPLRRRRNRCLMFGSKECTMRQSLALIMPVLIVTRRG